VEGGSSRLITATLEVDKGQLHVLCCYAFTFNAARQEEDKFYNSLHAALSLIPS
jgi:hypothetical protein